MKTANPCLAHGAVQALEAIPFHPLFSNAQDAPNFPPSFFSMLRRLYPVPAGQGLHGDPRDLATRPATLSVPAGAPDRLPPRTREPAGGAQAPLSVRRVR